MTVLEHERDPDARRPLTDAMTWGGRQRLWMRVYKRERDRFEAERDEARQQLAGAVDRAERLHEELTVFVDACGHCLAGGRPPNQGMIDAARITLHENRGQSA